MTSVSCRSGLLSFRLCFVDWLSFKTGGGKGGGEGIGGSGGFSGGCGVGPNVEVLGGDFVGPAIYPTKADIKGLSLFNLSGRLWPFQGL